MSQTSHRTEVNIRKASDERCQSIFEDFPGHPDLPLPPIPSLSDSGAVASLGFEDSLAARWVLRAAFALSGFGWFHRSFLDEYEKYFARVDGDLSFCAPVVSAALSLVDAGDTSPLKRAARLLGCVWEFHAAIRSGGFSPEGVGTVR